MKTFKQFLTESEEYEGGHGEPHKFRIVRRPTPRSIDPAFKALDLSNQYVNFPISQSKTDTYVNVARDIERLSDSDNPTEHMHFNMWMDTLEDPGISNRQRIKELRKIAMKLVADKRKELQPAEFTKDATELKPRNLKLSTRLFKNGRDVEDLPENLPKGFTRMTPSEESLYLAMRNIPHYREVLEKPEPKTIIPSASAKSKVLNVRKPR